MEFFIGNIDAKNITLLTKAGSGSSVQYEQGAYMSSSLNQKKDYDFYPIFCSSKTEGAKLLKVYFELAKNSSDSSSFENDLYMLSEQYVENA